MRRLLDLALSGGGIDAAFSEVRIAPGSVHRLVLVVVNSERDPARNIDESDQVPGTSEVVDALLFGAGNRATVETQEFLADVARRFKDDLRTGHRWPSFAADAELYLILVNLRDAPGESRRALLQVPTAFTISNDEVTSLIAAGRAVLRASPDFQALKRSLGVPATP